MKNLERKDILNVKKHTKNKSVFNNFTACIKYFI